MTPQTKELFRLLLTGKYFRRRMNPKGESVVVVYQGKQDPVKSFSAIAGNELHHLLKTDRKDKLKFTLNLNKVRQLDGRSWLKKSFKKYKIKQQCNDLPQPQLARSEPETVSISPQIKTEKLTRSQLTMF